MQQEDRAQADEDQGSYRNFARVQLVAGTDAGTECGSQSKWIRRRLPQLYGAGSADGVDNLVEVESRDSEAADHAQGLASAARPQDQQGEDDEMSQAFGVLPGVNRAHAEGKKSSENSGQSRIGARARGGNRARSDKAWGGRRHRRLNPFESRRQAGLAVNHSMHGARAGRTQRFPASTAKRHRRYIGMVGAVPESLL